MYCNVRNWMCFPTSCSGSLFSMPLFKKLYWIQIFKINCLVTTLYKVFNRYSTSISFFFSFFGESTMETKENTCCTLGWPSRMRTQVFLLARGSHHNVEMAQKLGKRVKKSENFNPRTTMTTISWSCMKTKSRQRHD